MHINEQTPEDLETLLTHYFEHVLVWVTSDNKMVGSLEGHYPPDKLNASRNIFAVASHQPVHVEELISMLSQRPLDRNGLCVDVELLHLPQMMEPNHHYTLQVRLCNRGKECFKSLLPNPVYISYHWLDQNGEPVVFDGIRTPIQPPIPPMSMRDVSVEIITPHDGGEYILQITLVQEFQFWFEQILPNFPLCVNCMVQNSIYREKAN